MKSGLWEESYIDGKGRILLAKRDIQPNEIVLEDTAFVSVPDGRPVCLGCLDHVTASSPLCDRCSWPMCSDVCPQAVNHAAECEVLASAGFNVKIDDFTKAHMMYTIVPVLKVVLLKVLDKEKYRLVEELMDHWEERRKIPQIEGIVKFMSAIFRKKLGLAWVTDEDTQHAFGALKTNGLGQDGRACYMYPDLSLMSHSCSSNVEIVGVPSLQVKFKSKRFIPAGEELSWSYTNTLEHRSTIRRKLKSTWMFDCTCTRCGDPSEFGTYFSSKKCTCGGYKIQQNEKTTCTGCGTIEEISIKELQLLEEVRRADAVRVVQLLEQLEGVEEYHPNHILSSRITMRLLDVCYQSNDKELMLKIMKRSSHLLKTLELLEGVNSRPYTRYKSILGEIAARQK